MNQAQTQTTRARTVQRKMLMEYQSEDKGNVTYAYFSEASGKVEEGVVVCRQTYEDLGSPGRITVTIQPGNKMGI